LIELSCRDGVSVIAFSQDGKTFAFADQRNNVLLWDTSTGKLFRELKGHSNNVKQMGWSPDGKVFTTACTRINRKSSICDIKYWNLENGKELDSIEIREGGAILAISRECSKLVTGGFPLRTAIVWDLPRKEKLTVLAHHDHVRLAVISSDGARLATSDGPRVWLWDPKLGLLLWKFGLEHVDEVEAYRLRVHGLAFSPLDNAVVAQPLKQTHLTYLDIKTGKDRNRALPRPGRFFGFSKDGAFLATAPHEGGIDLWSTAKLEKLATLSAKDVVGIKLLAISPDGRYLAAVNNRNSLWVWDIPKVKR